jgi:hypothetical protein
MPATVMMAARMCIRSANPLLQYSGKFTEAEFAGNFGDNFGAVDLRTGHPVAQGSGNRTVCEAADIREVGDWIGHFRCSVVREATIGSCLSKPQRENRP